MASVPAIPPLPPPPPPLIPPPGRWVHATCALFTPGVESALPTHMADVDGLDLIAPAAWAKRCWVCDELGEAEQRVPTAVAQCGGTAGQRRGRCPRWFHPMCALRVGWLLSLDAADAGVDDAADGGGGGGGADGAHAEDCMQPVMVCGWHSPDAVLAAPATAPTSCVVCRGDVAGAGAMGFACAGCALTVHAACLSPPMPAEARPVEWFCSACVDAGLDDGTLLPTAVLAPFEAAALASWERDIMGGPAGVAGEADVRGQPFNGLGSSPGAAVPHAGGLVHGTHAAAESAGVGGAGVPAAAQPTSSRVISTRRFLRMLNDVRLLPSMTRTITVERVAAALRVDAAWLFGATSFGVAGAGTRDDEGDTVASLVAAIEGSSSLAADEAAPASKRTRPHRSADAGASGGGEARSGRPSRAAESGGGGTTPSPVPRPPVADEAPEDDGDYLNALVARGKGKRSGKARGRADAVIRRPRGVALPPPLDPSVERALGLTWDDAVAAWAAVRCSDGGVGGTGAPTSVASAPLFVEQQRVPQRQVVVAMRARLRHLWLRAVPSLMAAVVESGRHLQLMGVGSKAALLDDLAGVAEQSFGLQPVRVDGNDPVASMAKSLPAIAAAAGMRSAAAAKCKTGMRLADALLARGLAALPTASPLSAGASVLQRLAQRRAVDLPAKAPPAVVVLIDSVDVLLSRQPEELVLLLKLLDAPQVRCVVTVDDPAAAACLSPAVQSGGVRSGVWVTAVVDTLLPYEREAAGHAEEDVAVVDATAGLHHVMASLTTTAHAVVRKLLQLAAGNDRRNGTPSRPWHRVKQKGLFTACRDDFVLTDAAVLMSVLVELADHRIVALAGSEVKVLQPRVVVMRALRLAGGASDALGDDVSVASSADASASSDAEGEGGGDSEDAF
jgi:hypothetical protein